MCKRRKCLLAEPASCGGVLNTYGFYFSYLYIATLHLTSVHYSVLIQLQRLQRKRQGHIFQCKKTSGMVRYVVETSLLISLKSTRNVASTATWYHIHGNQEDLQMGGTVRSNVQQHALLKCEKHLMTISQLNWHKFEKIVKLEKKLEDHMQEQRTNCSRKVYV